MTDDERPATPPDPEPTARPRGAGWDDEDDWVRRDLGPRPHVPDHGRRPLLMALPLFLITLAAVVALLLAGCGDDTEDGSGGAGGAAPTSATPEAVAAKVADGAALISGRANPDAFADTSCESTDAGGEYRCAYGGEGDPDSGALTVRLQPDGTVGKVLGGSAPQVGRLDPERVAALLAAEDAATGHPGVSYDCVTSTAVNPDGSSAQTTATGYRCFTTGKAPLQRYVQFAADGTANRDYEVTQP